MKNARFTHSLLATAVALLSSALLAAPVMAGGRQRKVNLPPTDSIDVIGHLSFQGGGITAVRTSEHWRRNYVELQDSSRRTLTLVDVTDAVHPSLAKQFDLPGSLQNANLELLVGSAALITDKSSQSTAATELRSVTIVSFADPEHPKTVQQFANVTVVRPDPTRGLIYLVNSDGLWVLKQHPAADQGLERIYAEEVTYDH